MRVIVSSTLRRGIFAAVMGAFAFVAAPAPGTAQPVTVTVGGRQMYLEPGPIERAGRVFVPMRQIFERLGAGVVYDSGAINATKGDTNIHLRIGSTRVVVNGEQQFIDVAPFIVGATTYVPLRFVAQSLGAQVGYDGATRVVAIENVGFPVPVRPVRPIPPPNPEPVIAIHLNAQQPPPGAYIANRFATISAQFSHPADAGSVRVWLDGNDITGRSGVSAYSFSYTPPAPLYAGSHTVRVAGYGARGLHFDRSWSFTTNGAPPPPVNPIELRNRQPAPGANVANRFVTISAEFSREVEVGSVRVWLDGNNITGRSGVSRSSFTYNPPAPLNFGTHTVRVAGRGLGGLDFDRSWSFNTAGAPPPTNPIELRGQNPAPGARIGNRFPTISAQFSRPVEVGSVRVLLDGNGITPRSGVSTTGFSYSPPAPLEFGSHTVRATGRGQGGLAFDRSWSFVVNQSGRGPIHLTISQPGPNAAVGRSFPVVGNTVANGRIRVTAGASTEATDQFTGNTNAGPLGNFRLLVTLNNVLIGQQTVRVKITATDPATSQSTTQTLQLRLTNQ